MNLLLNIENFGVSLEHQEGREYPYVFSYPDVAGPVYHEVDYLTLEEALTDIVSYIFNPNEVYAMDEQPEDIQRAFELLGVPIGVSENKYQAAAKTMMYMVLEGIARTNDAY